LKFVCYSEEDFTGGNTAKIVVDNDSTRVMCISSLWFH